MAEIQKYPYILYDSIKNKELNFKDIEKIINNINFDFINFDVNRKNIMNKYIDVFKKIGDLGNVNFKISVLE